MNWNDTLSRLIDLEDKLNGEPLYGSLDRRVIFAVIDDISSLIEDMIDEDRRYPDEPREDALNRMQWVEDSAARLKEEGIG